MTKTFKTTKKLVLIVLALCLFAVCGITIACGGNDPANDSSPSYTVTVKTSDGQSAVGVNVTIKKGGATFGTKTTGADGKVSFALADDDYEVVLANIPEHYYLPDDATLTLTATNRDLTVTLAANFAYRINLVTEDGEPYYAPNTSVYICTLAGNCLSPVPLGESGYALIEAEKTDYHAKIGGLPGTLAYPCDTDGYYTEEILTADVTEITITLLNVNAIDLDADSALTQEQKAEYAKTNANYTAALQAYPAHKTTVSVAAGAAEYFSITPDVDGKYIVLSNEVKSNVYLYNGVAFSTKNGQGMFTTLGSHLTLNAGKTYYFRIENSENTTVMDQEFLVISPAASYVQTSNAGKYDVTFYQAGAKAIIAFTPASNGGLYSATVQGDTLACVKNYTSDDAAEAAGLPAAAEYVKNSKCSVKVTPDAAASTTIYFAVAVSGVANYPATITVEIAKDSEVANTNIVVQVTEDLKEYTVPDGQELYAIPLDGSAQQIVYNATDKFYHYGSENGPVVVVLLTKALESDRFSEANPLIYLEKDNSRAASYILDVTSAADKESLNKGNTYKDYREFLRGFKDYDYVAAIGGYNSVIPEEKTVEKYYAKYVNSDGVYPLTTELKTFLEEFAAAYSAYLPLGVADGDKWLFPCYYYDTATEADEIVGTFGVYHITDDSNNTYELGDEGYWFFQDKELTPQSIILVIEKSGKFSIYLASIELDDNNAYQYYYDTSDAWDSGTWSKDGDNYSFECEYGSIEYDGESFTYTDSEVWIFQGKINVSLD